MSASLAEAGEWGGAPRIGGRSPWQVFWRRFWIDRVAIAGGVTIVILVLLALLAPVIAKLVGHGPNQLFQGMVNAFGLPLGPNGRFWFGADSAGRDVFVRTIYGARTSLAVAFLATGLAMVIGVLLGLTAGFYRGWVDTVISRAIDFVLSLPLLLFAIGISVACSTSVRGCLGGLVQPGLRLVVTIIALFTWPYIARIVRGMTLSLREKEFVESARSLGAGDLRIMLREIFPNLIAPVIVYTTLIIPSNILFEAALSFLGVGIPEHAFMGRDARAGRREPAVHLRVVDDVVPGALPPAHHAGLQPAGRRPARRAGSTAASRRPACGQAARSP
ncbi:MAG TPA: ABC transporter permease [Actinomycetota bacterium]